MIEDIQRLFGAIENGTREEIWEAAKQLESVAIEMVLFLVGVLEDAKRADTRAAAAYVLGFGRFGCARTSLEQVLDNAGEEAFVRGHAAEALAYIGDPRSVGVLLKHLEEKDPQVKYWCIFALGQIAGPEAVPALKHVAESVGDQQYEKYSLRAEALDALAEINERLRRG